MSLIRIDRNPSRRQLQVFALLWLVFFGGLATAAWIRQGPGVSTWILAGLSLGVPAVGMVVPGLLRWVYLGMAYATYPIGMAVSLLLLLVIYYLVVTPIGLVMRCCGYDAMGRQFDSNAATYWVPRQSDAARDASSYFRQF